MRFTKALLVILAVLTLVSVCSAEIEDQTTFVGLIKDITTNQPVSSLALIMKASNLNTGQALRPIIYLSQNGTFEYKFDPGNWVFDIMLYNPFTEEISYYAQRAVNIQKAEKILERNLYVTPVGAVEGTVLDDSDRLAIGADLDFKCAGQEKTEFPEKTDKFGTFRASLVPAGKCTIYAAYNGQVGSSEVVVEKGKLASTTINLNKKIITSVPIFTIIVIIILLMIILLLVIFIRRKIRLRIKETKDAKAAGRKKADKKSAKISRKNKHADSSASTEENQVKETEKAAVGNTATNTADAAETGQKELNPRARDILKTLNERENQIAKFLIDNNNQSTQATLRNATGIPKTTLVRVFQSLEAKKVIAVEKIGKMKKITLTDWFLGKN